MRIIPYEGRESLEDIDGLSIIIKAIPFEDGYAPAFVLVSPDEDYLITIEEASCLMDGIEIANEKIDELIAFILQSKIHDTLGSAYEDYEESEYLEDNDDTGESD